MERRNRGKEKKEAIIDGINDKEKKKKQACVKKDACQSPVADNRSYKTRLVTFLVRRHDAIDSVYIGGTKTGNATGRVRACLPLHTV